MAAVLGQSRAVVDRDQTKIYQHHRRGESVEDLASGSAAARQHLSDDFRDARPADPGIAFGPYPQRAVRREFCVRRNSEAGTGPMPRQRGAPKKARLPSGLPPYLASLYEVPLLTRQQEVPPVPQDELPEVQGRQLREKLDPSHPKTQLDGPDRAALRRGRGHQEPDHPRQSAAGRVDRQAARRRRRRTSSSWSATATCR